MTADHVNTVSLINVYYTSDREGFVYTESSNTLLNSV